jgi:hypothetical protein
MRLCEFHYHFLLPILYHSRHDSNKGWLRQEETDSDSDGLVDYEELEAALQSDDPDLEAEEQEQDGEGEVQEDEYEEEQEEQAAD